ncbi:MAG: SIMPL domain-containing protein [Cyanobacteria bacterium J06621_8]
MIVHFRKLNFAGLTLGIKYLSNIVIVCSLFSLPMNAPAIAQELLKTLTVTGNGVKKIPSTMTRVDLGVEIPGKTASEVQQEVAQKTAAVIDLLKTREVEQLQTTGIRLSPIYDRVNTRSNQRVLTGYLGTNTVSFQVETKQAGELLDAAVKAGATRVDRVSFTATPEALAVAKKEALRLASINAQERAEVVLETLNLRAKDIVNVEVDAAQIRQPPPIAREQFALESAVATPVIPGEQTVQATVTLQISY